VVGRPRDRLSFSWGGGPLGIALPPPPFPVNTSIPERDTGHLPPLADGGAPFIQSDFSEPIYLRRYRLLSLRAESTFFDLSLFWFSKIVIPFGPFARFLICVCFAGYVSPPASGFADR